MSINRLRPIPTPFKKYPSYRSKTTRIKIPQPEDRPLVFRRKNVLRTEYIKKSPWWYIFHRKGLQQTLVGEDPLEARAVSKNYIRGTLPERIMYKYLTEKMHFISGVDFDFQSSLSGGRLELGGLVVDFLFEMMRLILQVDGPTHIKHRQMRKDEEQEDILASMGYTVYRFSLPEIYDVATFEDKIHRIFNLASSGGSGQNWQDETIRSETEEQWDEVFYWIGAIRGVI